MIHEREYVKVRYFNIIPRTTSAESYIGEKMFPSNAKHNRGSRCLVNGIGLIGKVPKIRVVSYLNPEFTRFAIAKNPTSIFHLHYLSPYPPTAIHYI
ncbi:uncharacterized protein OCT59_004750 [Rhizophagus irregularis]|uniref:Uncharacterized protein n=1 Tax=Rhizophagus irregularis TaxID=588596 RepID=A0A915YXW7_9GLOM|nr:hypothetical protein OCT59_004750 [Rhizophagus irregularis]GET63080.1 hypothetical protein RIR_jg21870.t1 [Rhizophagus irregularis DAOM 181602=DAOM 197198]CAB5353570.1 unnamed protein product [Rhizophagus irregularis]